MLRPHFSFCKTTTRTLHVSLIMGQANISSAYRSRCQISHCSDLLHPCLFRHDINLTWVCCDVRLSSTQSRSICDTRHNSVCCEPARSNTVNPIGQSRLVREKTHVGRRVFAHGQSDLAVISSRIIGLTRSIAIVMRSIPSLSCLMDLMAIVGGELGRSAMLIVYIPFRW